MKYESEINQLPDGKFEVITIGKEHESIFNSALKEHGEEFYYKYPSLNSLRRSLVREKFHTEIYKYGGFAATCLGYFLMGAAVLNNEHLMIKLGLFFAGIFPATYGPPLQQLGQRDGPTVKSRIEAFNNKFSDLAPLTKPVHFSAREYLSTIGISIPNIRIPFIHR